MKNLLALAIIVLGFSAASFAQTATATGTLVSAITIATSGTGSMNFGNIVAGKTGTVVLPGVAAPTRSQTGSIILPATGTVSSAAFIVSGTSGLAYTVTLPSSVTAVGTSSLTINNFSCDIATAGTPVVGTTATSTLAASTRTFYVGATLNVTAADLPGTYTSVPFTVTVNYN